MDISDLFCRFPSLGARRQHSLDAVYISGNLLLLKYNGLVTWRAHLFINIYGP